MKVIIVSQLFKDSGKIETLIVMPFYEEYSPKSQVEEIVDKFKLVDFARLTNDLGESVISSLNFGPIFAKIHDI